MTDIFSSVVIGTLSLRNRLVRSATAEGLGDSKGRPMPRLEVLHRELARGGVGLIVMGHAFVHPSGKNPTMVGLHEDALIAPLRALTDAVHDEGGSITAQINHVGRQARGADAHPIAPSSVPFRPLDGSARQALPARAMKPSEIGSIIDAYAAAAGRAKAAGFDAVQVHAAHGYLISQFLSPLTNQRDDDWGGDAIRRRRFLEAVISAVRAEVGSTFPLLVKLGLADEEPGGVVMNEGLETLVALSKLRPDAIEISGGIATSREFSLRPGVVPGETEAYFLPSLRAARQATADPLILVGGLRSRARMQTIIAEGDADLLALSRPLIREPDLPRRMQDGQPSATCISCNRCWAGREGDGISCKVP